MRDAYELELALDYMARHSQENPDHGHNCACKDKQLARARRWYNSLPDQEKKEFRYIAAVLLRDPT